MNEKIYSPAAKLVMARAQARLAEKEQDQVLATHAAKLEAEAKAEIAAAPKIQNRDRMAGDSRMEPRDNPLLFLLVGIGLIGLSLVFNSSGYYQAGFLYTISHGYIEIGRNGAELPIKWPIAIGFCLVLYAAFLWHRQRSK